ncbi:hypothetical protein [Tardiphaga robiniae]|uniref:Uncharacterized protein n=1 Tax=Tardiphaga robiniae TaxID=943830 RepID=A0A161R733_9BRAD|nr:hypothetical protein [Tardiphaga robiniae]KZD25121.1 hypothetical protein A4A58_01195 [Tardiphaga robiniae]
MDIPEFEDLLGRHGEDVSSWPEDRRDAALALLRTSEQARAALAEAQLLRRALSPGTVRAPDGLVDRIMQKARQSDVAPTRPATKPDKN